MCSKRMLVVLLLLLVAASGSAADLKGKTSVGVRFPVFMPLFNGDNFTSSTGSRQPFMMGWDFGIEVKRGFSDQWMLGFTANYLTTYDDTTSIDNSGDELNNSDNATAKLTGMVFGAQAYWFYEPDWRFQPYLLAGVGADLWKVKDVVTDDSYGSTDLNVKIGTGLLFPVNENFTIDAQVKLTRDFANLSEDFPAGFYGPDTWEKYSDRPFKGYLEVSVGLAYLFGGEPDTDGDGVPDKKDQCPGTPEGVTVDASGCPIDTDGDGVADYLDKCPDTPKAAPVDAQGCPLDSDGDGVFDYLDNCPNTPKGWKVDAAGCPFDDDGDGVVNESDKCPDTPDGAEVDANGCPLDSDKDGVLDYLDKCPGTPAGIEVDETGCPKILKKGEKITLHINFPSNSYEIDDESKVILDGVAQTMQSFPEIKIRVSGFTDNTGSAGHNQQLSENRAKAVVTYLESKGVEGSRMSSVGYGETPEYFVGDNTTEEGRALNRRVELESVE
ncbi:MAG: OmpA family protein [Candidatus Zixiibacteriota bacterium]